MDKIKKEDKENTLHFILVGVLLNGIIQGSKKKQLNLKVLELAKKEIKKLYE